MRMNVNMLLSIYYPFHNPKAWKYLVEHPEMASNRKGISPLAKVRYFNDLKFLL